MRDVVMVLYAMVAFLVIVASFLIDFSDGKSCTNLINDQILIANDESWRKKHRHLTHTDEHTWANMLPRKGLRQQGDVSNWEMVYRTMKNPEAQKSLTGVLNEVSLHNVTLDPGSFHGRAQQTNLEYMLMLDVDSLVWSFRKTAGLPTPGTSYGGWESPSEELRGHFVGHYMSASAHMWASTHNDSIKTKMDAVVTALAECQDKMQPGYLSAFPEELFDRLENLKPVWAPYYTIHKIMAGLLDQYELASNAQALKMVTSMADYFFNRVQNVIIKYSIERHWSSLNDEHGGMNDVLYRLYTKTGNKNHLILAHLFDKPCFLGSLALQIDELSGFHANTHIPVVIGTQMRYEVVGDQLYKDMSTFFMDIVNASHTYATGGTSSDEHWTDPMRLADTLSNENEESCTTYNMLKISRTLFRWTKEMAYADHYERALTNGVLGIQRGEDPGVMIYMLPLGHAVSKAISQHGWGTQYDSFWCCYGTGIESFSKLGDSIYFEDDRATPGLFIIQYISSSLQWKSGLSINMKVDPVASYDPYLNVTITLSLAPGASSTSPLNLRIPSWVSGVATAFYNTEPLVVPPPGSYLTVAKTWKSGDNLTLALPMAPRLEAIKDDRPEFATTQAVLYGPYLLAGLTEDDWAIKTGKGPISNWLIPIPAPSYNSQLITLAHASTPPPGFALARNESLITMKPYPSQGSNVSVHATFRIIIQGQSPLQPLAQNNKLNKPLTLEPFDLPGVVIVHQGKENNLAFAAASGAGKAAVFQLVPGLNGQQGTVSLESITFPGCFVYSSTANVPLQSAKLSCGNGSNDFKQGTSFVMQPGVSQYHPISFIAVSPKRNYVMQPLNTLQDEYYNVYFDIQH